MARWSVEQVLETAPDDSSRKAAKGLTSPRYWSELGSTEVLLWGKCQGSGKNPYQVSVDLDGPAHRCTCPSRKFRCKHGVALMLLWAANDGSVADAKDVADPVEVLFGIQLGGGNGTPAALTYCRSLIRNPSNTILVLISDLYRES